MTHTTPLYSLRRLPLVALLGALTLSVACDSDSPTAPTPTPTPAPAPGPTVSSVQVSGTNSIGEDDTSDLTATATLSDNSTMDVTDEATWESNNTAVATVNDSGRVTAVSPGTAVISATYEGRTGQITMQVNMVDNIQVVTVRARTLRVTGTCDNNSIFESSSNGEFSFTFHVTPSGDSRRTVWSSGRQTYRTGSRSVSASTTFTRNVTEGDTFNVRFTGTEFDGLLGADSRFNGRFRGRNYVYSNGTWTPSSRSLELSGGSQCGATLDFTIDSNRQ